MSKKLIALIVVFLLFLTPSVVYAQKGTASIPEVKEAVEAEKRYDEGQLNSRGLFTDQFHNVQANIVRAAFPTEGDPGSQGAFIQVGNLIADLYTPPATVDVYIADLMNSAGLNIAQPAYAQGLGFASLDPILDTWKVFRNVAYLFYVILFLIIGFMIMFRRQISGQAAVTAQQALPQIIVSLIAVTFSYAIAGFLIEVMYLSMYLILGLFSNQTIGDGDVSLRSLALDKNIFQIGIDLLTKGGAIATGQDVVKDIVEATFAVIGNFGAASIGFIGELTFAVVFALATMFGIFRLFFELLRTYISIIISIVLSPLALMLGALPGNNAFKAWIKTLVANLAVFPGILVILALTFMLIGNAYGGSNTIFSEGEFTGGFLPPYIPGAGSGNAISVMIGLAVILILPDLAGQIKKSLGGSGGIFEQFANNFTSAMEKGWKGGELVPGLGISDTRKWLGEQTGGLSGENLTRKSAIVAATLGRMGVGGSGAVVGKAARYGEQRFRRIPGVKSIPGYEEPIFKESHSIARGFLGPQVGNFAQWLGGNLGDQQINDEKKSGKKGH